MGNWRFGAFPKLPYSTMQQLNLDWILDRIRRFLPDTGTKGQVLTRTKDGAAWVDPEAAPVQSVNGQTGAVRLAIPDSTSDLTNDSGFITAAQAAAAAPVQSVNGQTGAVAIKAFSNLAYSQAQDISALTSIGGTFTAPDYGFIFGELVKDDDSDASQYELKVGNTIVVRYRAGITDVFYSSFCIPIAKGNTITVSRCSNMFFLSSSYLPKFIAI